MSLCFSLRGGEGGFIGAGTAGREQGINPVKGEWRVKRSRKVDGWVSGGSKMLSFKECED